MKSDLYADGTVRITDDRFMSDDWKYRQAFERALPELFPEHGKHSMTCPCRGTDGEGCAMKKGTYPYTHEAVAHPYAALYGQAT